MIQIVIIMGMSDVIARRREGEAAGRVLTELVSVLDYRGRKLFQAHDCLMINKLITRGRAVSSLYY